MDSTKLEVQHLGLSGEARDTVARANSRFLRQLHAQSELPGVLGIVLAGGAATRFRPLTASREQVEQGLAPAGEGYSAVPWAKPALPLKGQPLIDYTLEDLARMGSNLIILNIARPFAPERVIAAVGDGSWLGPDTAVAYLVEEVPTGTYGGVMHMLDLALQARSFPGDTTVAIFSGDIYTVQAGSEILEYHLKNHNDFTLMLNPVPDSMKGEFGTVVLGPDGRIVEFREKDPASPSNLNNSSRYLVRLDLLERYRPQLTPVPVDKARHREPGLFFDFGLHLFPLLLRGDTRFAGFVSERDWADLGRVDDYLEVQVRLMAQGNVRQIEAGARVGDEVQRPGPHLVESGAEVTGRTTLDNVHVGQGWRVKGSDLQRVVLLPLPAGVSYSVEGSTLKDCVVACGTLHGYQASGRLIVTDGSKLVEKTINL